MSTPHDTGNAATARAPMTPSVRLQQTVRAQLLMILAQVLLGMGVNLIGMPSETQALAHTATMVILISHIVVALAILGHAVLVVVRSRSVGAAEARLGWAGGGSVLASIIAGGLAFSPPGRGWWSYLMTVGAVAAIIFYGAIIVRSAKSGS